MNLILGTMRSIDHPDQLLPCQREFLVVEMMTQTKFLEGDGSPELRRGVSKCAVAEFFVKDVLTWFPLKDDAKEVTVLFETFRDTLLGAVIVVILFIRNVCCLQVEMKPD